MKVSTLMRKPVFWESVALSLMCLVDVFVTVLVVGNGWAVEANPLMAFFMKQGIAAFVFAKTATFIPGIIACEYLKHRNHTFALWAVRAGAAGYLALYVIGDLKINHLL